MPRRWSRSRTPISRSSAWTRTVSGIDSDRKSKIVLHACLFLYLVDYPYIVWVFFVNRLFFSFYSCLFYFIYLCFSIFFLYFIFISRSISLALKINEKKLKTETPKNPANPSKTTSPLKKKIPLTVLVCYSYCCCTKKKKINHLTCTATSHHITAPPTQHNISSHQNQPLAGGGRGLIDNKNGTTN